MRLRPTHLSRTPVAVLLLAAPLVPALLGCLDRLPEGVYACSKEGRGSGCPRGWYCRNGDAGGDELRCYSSPGGDDLGGAHGSADSGGTGDDSGMDHEVDGDAVSTDGGTREGGVDTTDRSTDGGRMDAQSTGAGDSG